jgi:hypothetical protein
MPKVKAGILIMRSIFERAFFSIICAILYIILLPVMAFAALSGISLYIFDKINKGLDN